MKTLIILFDGPCVFCNFWVRFLCRIDRKDAFRFASLQSEWAQKWASQNQISLQEYDSLFVIDNSGNFTFADQAVFTIIKSLGWVWKVFLVFSLIPKRITHFLYRSIARNRYAWFGKFNQCPLPQKRYLHKFL